MKKRKMVLNNHTEVAKIEIPVNDIAERLYHILNGTTDVSIAVVNTVIECIKHDNTMLLGLHNALSGHDDTHNIEFKPGETVYATSQVHRGIKESTRDGDEIVKTALRPIGECTVMRVSPFYKTENNVLVRFTDYSVNSNTPFEREEWINASNCSYITEDSI
jgi:hypothetical protein